MTHTTGYRVMSTERKPDGTEVWLGSSPKLDETAMSRDEALAIFGDIVGEYDRLRLSALLLHGLVVPPLGGPRRIAVVTDDVARERRARDAALALLGA